jgi:flagellar basal body-associated protein FliL
MVDPKQSASYRMLRAVVIVLGVLIVIALAVLVAGLVMRFGAKTAGAPSRQAASLPENAKILDMQSQPNRLILRLATPAGEEVDIIDTGDGHLVSRVEFRHAR